MPLPGVQTIIGFDNSSAVMLGDFTFDSVRQVRCAARNIEAEDGVTIIGHERTYTIAGYLYDSTNAGGFAEYMFAELMQPRQTFVIQNAGISDITVSQFVDIADGPKVLDLHLEPVGGSNCYLYTIVIRVTLPNTCGSSYYHYPPVNGNVRALVYDVDWTINESQFQTRTISGYIELNNTRGANGVVSRNANELRNQLWDLHPVLPRFKRTQSYHESTDKRRLSFSIVDREIESPDAFPELAANISGRHRARWARGKEGAIQPNYVSLEVELSPYAVDRILGFKYFLDVLFAKMNFARKNGATVFLDVLEIQDDLFSYNQSFQASFRLLGEIKTSDGETGGIGPSTILAAGPTQPMPFGRDTTAWLRCNRALPGGNANLRDAGNQFGTASSCTGVLDPLKRQDPYRDEVGYVNTDNRRTLQNEKPPSDKSYLKYENSHTEESENPVMQLPYTQESQDDSASGGSSDPIVNPGSENPLGTPGSANQNTPEATSDSDPADTLKNKTTYNGGRAVGTAHEIQVSGIKRKRYIMSGSAVRVGYPVPRPQIAKIGDQDAVEGRAVFSQKQLAYQFGQPVYGAAWQIEYLVENSPGQVDVFQNFQQKQLNGVS